MGQQTQTAREDLTGTTVGRYVVLRRLGTGGMGEVYLAEDSKLKRTVALKRMGARLRSDERYRQRFLKEAERASRLMHPQIAALYDILEIEGEMFLVIEYVNGHTLRKAIRDPLDFATFLRVAVQCADALEAAHSCGLVHRDIKPENIMLTQSGSIKILDFGLAKDLPAVSATDTVENIATTGALSGTPAYMAPEVLMELRPDGRADIFSLGVVLYEILTSQHPFLANSFIETTERIIRQSPPPICDLNSKVPAEIEQRVMRMLAKDPTERYESASQMADDLRRLQKEMEFEPSPEQPGRASRESGVAIPPIRWNTSSLLAAGLLLVMSIALGMLAWQLYRGNIQGRMPAKRHLAVLPFSTVGNDPASAAFSDGLSETLTVKLTQLTDKYPLEVVPSSELRSEKVSTADQARRTFSVNLVLEGQLQIFGNQVRINYSLVDPLSRRQLRADTITADYADPFAVEDRVVDSVLGKLNLELQRQEREAIRTRETSDPEAYEFYLRGRGYLQDYEKTENLDSAITALGRALEKDPKYSTAEGSLGQAYIFKYRQTHDAAWIERARQECDQALRLSDRSVEGHICLGSLYNTIGKYDQAAPQFRRTVELDPTSGTHYLRLASAYQKLNSFAEAEKTLLKAVQLQRDELGNYKWLGYFYVNVGRFQDAANVYKKMVDLAPDNFRGYQNLGAMYIYLGKYGDAIPALEKSVNIRPTAGAYSNLATAHFYLKNYPAAAGEYRQAIALDPRDYTYWRNLGDAYYFDAGAQNEANTAYTKAVELCMEALRVNSKDVLALRSLAISQAMLGQQRLSLEAARVFLELSPKDPVSLFDAALVHAQFRQPEITLDLLAKALQAGTKVALIRDTPVFQPMLKDPRFHKLLQKFSEPVNRGS